MRKILFLTSILLLPLSAYAQTEVSDTIIQKAANDLKPAFCKSDLGKAIEIVKECYNNTQPLNIDKTNQCVIEDFTVNGLVQMQRKKAATNGDPEPFAGNEFFNPDNIQVRLIKYENSYSYGNQSSEVMHKKLYNDTMRVALALDRDNCFTIGKNH